MAVKPCYSEGCAGNVFARGLCVTHYGRMQRYGDASLKHPPGRVTPSMDEVLWSKVEKTDDCWLWNGHVDFWGKGMFAYKGLHRSAHGYAYSRHHNFELTRRDLLRHTCGVGACVRPEHLRLAKDIIADRRQGN